MLFLLFFVNFFQWCFVLYKSNEKKTFKKGLIWHRKSRSTVACIMCIVYASVLQLPSIDHAFYLLSLLRVRIKSENPLHRFFFYEFSICFNNKVFIWVVCNNCFISFIYVVAICNSLNEIIIYDTKWIFMKAK